MKNAQSESVWLKWAFWSTGLLSRLVLNQKKILKYIAKVISMSGCNTLVSTPNEYPIGNSSGHRYLQDRLHQVCHQMPLCRKGHWLFHYNVWTIWLYDLSCETFWCNNLWMWPRRTVKGYQTYVVWYNSAVGASFWNFNSRVSTRPFTDFDYVACISILLRIIVSRTVGDSVVKPILCKVQVTKAINSIAKN